MFEAKLAEGFIFKRIVEAIKDLVTDVNLDVSPSGKYYHLIRTQTSSIKPLSHPRKHSFNLEVIGIWNV